MNAYAINSWGCLALALVNADLAEQKNRSRLTWFLLSLLLEPIATLLIVVWATVPKSARPAPPIRLSTGILALGILLTIASKVLGVVAWTSRHRPIWIAAGIFFVAVLACFVAFIVPKDETASPSGPSD
ncbi:hypothetical protein ACLRGF_01510 [Mycetocola zhadangensis]|uniref:hypothetical protein n=1 Tax=Mycetocola zhadangensis TaxID=1164595 RepID=UPI003A4DBEB4